MPSRASCASTLLRAATTATHSPTWLTWVTASEGAPGFTMSGVTGQAQGTSPWTSLKSSPVNTAITPGRLLASVVSIAVIFACAIGLRRIARCSIPGRVMLSVQVVRPVIRWASSRRRRDLPISADGGVLDRRHDCAPAVAPAAARAAFTMFW